MSKRDRLAVLFFAVLFLFGGEQKVWASWVFFSSKEYEVSVSEYVPVSDKSIGFEFPGTDGILKIQPAEIRRYFFRKLNYLSTWMQVGGMTDKGTGAVSRITRPV
jgi:hypothetical protein